MLKYAETHCLKINYTKTNVLLFGPSPALEVIFDQLCIKVNDHLIKPVSEAKTLGVTFDSSLRFRNHITTYIRRGYGGLKLIYNKRHFMDIKTKSAVCNALVLSGLSYCDYVYGPSIDTRDARRIQVLQNSCLRLIYGIRRRQHISHKLEENKWLDMANRRLHHAATLYHKIMLYKCPPYLLNKITFRSDVHNVNIRFGGTVSVPAHKTETFKRCYSYQICIVYNNIPDKFKSINDINKFKKTLWRWLFDTQCSKMRT